MNNIRAGIGKRDDKYTLSGFLEMDEGYLEHSGSTNPEKRGRGTKNRKIMIVAEPSLEAQRS